MGAITQQLLNILLINEKDLIPYSDYGIWKLDAYVEQKAKIKKIERLFQPAITTMKDNLSHWLKHFRGQWHRIQPTKAAAIMKEQFLIDNLKKELEDARLNRSRYQEGCKNELREYRETSFKLSQECRRSLECKQDLQSHLDSCTNGCSLDHIAYECRYIDNGRCIHYYRLEEIERYADDYDCIDEDYKFVVWEKEYDYERALGIQKLGLEAYNKYERERSYDDF